MREGYLLEKMNARMVSTPRDASVLWYGARVPLKIAQRVTFFVMFGADVDDPATVAVTLNQHTLNTAGSSKVLEIKNPYFTKKGDAVIFTRHEINPDALSEDLDVTTLMAADKGLLVIEVLGEDLDVANDYAWVSLDVNGAVEEKYVSVLAISHHGDYKTTSDGNVEIED